MRERAPRLAVMLAGAALAVASMPAAAQQTAPVTPDSAAETYKDWVMTCGRAQEDQPLQCGIVQNISIKETGQTVVRLTFQKPPAGEPGLNGTFLLPLGIGLTAGLKVQIDAGQVFVLGFEQCLPQGCLVRWKLSPSVVTALKAGREMKATVEDADGDKLDVPMSLLGFTEALGALERRR